MHSLIGEYAARHAREGKRYGATGENALPAFLPHVLALKPRSLIDYGCGQSALADTLSRKAAIARTARYDPAVPKFSTRPEERFDLLVSVDVFEHIPDEEIDAAALDMATLADNALLMIDTKESGSRMSDGRSLHVSVHDERWWLERLRRTWPTLEPIPAIRPHRVAFKTFSQTLSPAITLLIVKRELWLRRGRRLAIRAGRAYRSSPAYKYIRQDRQRCC